MVTQQDGASPFNAPIKVIGKAGLVLRLFLDEGPELQLQRIAERADLDISTAARIVTSLTSIGVLRYDAVQRLYSPGLMLLEMSRAVLSRFGFRELAHRELLALSSERGWVCYLGVPDDEHEDQLVYIDVVTTQPNAAVRTELGQRRIASSTASGLVLLAYGRIDAQPLIANDPSLEEKLETVRTEGWAHASDAALVGVAVPLREASGRVVATFGAELRLEEFESDRDGIVETLKNKALGINSAIELSATRDVSSQYRGASRSFRETFLNS